ncbi:response regulator transcription factor [Bacillus sp. FJAT-27245]|uniref:response regulator transcription factor n=1 Tax=Bacillus sp. FJAT-27245 TaxID=1684144 RepID=UPI0006A79DCD|nr:response regulator transcription factor [Bacillus sp. FJAT-27245]
MEKKILIIEEDSQRCAKLLQFFGSYFSVTSYNNGLQGLISAIEWRPNVVIINHSLIDVNSIELCRQIRQKFQTIIIILGKPLPEDQIIKYFEAGADDVVLNPISYPVLLCKIKVLLDLVSMKRSGEEEVIQFGKLKMNRNNYKVYHGKKELNFTKKEFAILWILAKKQDVVVTREELLKVVWSYEHLEDDRMIDTHLNRIRKKLKQNEVNLTIKTVWGIGYKLQNEEVDVVESIGIPAESQK